MDNKKLLFAFAAIAIAITVPLVFKSSNLQNIRSSSVLAAQTQSNELGTVTANLDSNLSQTTTTNTTKDTTRAYGVTVVYGNGINCYKSNYSYRVNGLKFSASGTEPTGNLCTAFMKGVIHSTANCNTFSLIPPSGFHSVGIGYKRIDSGLENFTFEKVTSKKLCNNNYIVVFAMERN